MNIFYGNKRIVIVGVNGNQTAKDVAEQLKQEGIKNTVLLDMPKSYRDYYSLAELKPDYTLVLEESSACKVQPYKIEGHNGTVGKRDSRDLTESQKAKECYRHYLQILEFEPYMLGAQEIPFEDVKHIPWYYQDKTPLLHLKTQRVEGIADAVCSAIKDYFKA